MANFYTHTLYPIYCPMCGFYRHLHFPHLKCGSLPSSVSCWLFMAPPPCCDWPNQDRSGRSVLRFEILLFKCTCLRLFNLFNMYLFCPGCSELLPAFSSARLAQIFIPSLQVNPSQLFINGSSYPHSTCLRLSQLVVQVIHKGWDREKF